MTAPAAGLSPVPIALAAGQPGKEILQPLAVVILGGLISSTLLDIVVTPAVFGRGTLVLESTTVSRPLQRLPMMLNSLLTSAAILATLAVAPVAWADEHAASGAPPAHHEAKEPEVPMPTNFAAAVDAIDVRVSNIARLIEQNKLANLHVEAAAIKKIAGGMSKLVAVDGSGVPTEAYPEVLTASKTLSALFGRVDEAGDSGNVQESRRAQAALAEQLAVLRKYAPAQQVAAIYACPMHPDMTAAGPGKCPKCGMALVKKGSN